jgi:2-dehydropantoate 2-reductase
MHIAIIGLGAIGSTFAFHLARAGHEVTVVARGQRLEQMQRDGAIVTSDGARAAVRVSAALDTSVPFDLVLVTVLAHQVDAVLPTLAKSAARTVMFMFNTFAPLAELRAAVGAARFAFGFPSVLGTLEEGKLNAQVQQRGMLTTVTDDTWRRVFSEAGIPSVVHIDMESWLRTHAALVVPFMIATVLAYRRSAGLSWVEAAQLARALDEGVALVRRLGNRITPAFAVVLSRLPTFLVAAIMWTATRVPALRRLGALGAREPLALIDAMDAMAPGQLPTLRAVRPAP